MSSEAGESASSGDINNEILDLAFDPTGSTLPPPLRPPALSQAQILAAVELGFSDKYLPTSGSNTPSDFTNGYYRRQPQQNQTDQFVPDYTQEGSSNSNFSTETGPYFDGGDCTDGNFGQQRYEEQEGILPPLRRPNINEIPANVLAIILKNPKFDDILSPCQPPNQQQGQTQYNSEPQQHPGQRDPRMASRSNSSSSPNNQQMSNSTSQQHQQQTPQSAYRQDRQSSGSSSSHRSQQSPGQPQPGQRNNTNPSQDYPSNSSPRSQRQPQSPQPQKQPPRFSLSAKEFVPSTAPNYGSMNYSQEEAELAQAVAQIQMQHQGNQIDYNQGNNYMNQHSNENESDDSDLVLSTVTDSIVDLTSHPANFKRCAKAMIDVLKKHLGDTDTLGVVVTLIVEQSIANTNFSYSGARLCQLLRKEGICVGNKTFHSVLLTCCQEEFMRGIAEYENNPVMVGRCRGILIFFGELYTNIRIEKPNAPPAPMDILALSVLEMMQKLAKDPSHDNVKSVCQVLKLVGWELEKSSSEKVKSEIEKLMKDLSYLCMAGSGIKPQTKLLLETMFELKSKKWNRVESEEPTPLPKAPSPAPSNSSSSGWTPTSQPYEIPESDDDDFYEAGLMIDDEPEEVQKAYEEFLKMNKK